MYIYENVSILTSMWYVLRFEHAHVLNEGDCNLLIMILLYLLINLHMTKQMTN